VREHEMAPEDDGPALAPPPGEIEVSAEDLDEEFEVTAARRPRKKKRRRFPGETYFANTAGQNVGKATMDGLDHATAEEIRLEPSASVLREGDENMIALEEQGASLDQIMAKAMELGYDAVRVKDRAAILNQDAIASRTPVKRPGWSAK
jgi:hypothetical protein